jgi:propionyl-CoA carboxylase beta chain
MSGKHLAADVNYAYPTAEIAVMGPEGACNIVFKREIESAQDKEATRAKLIEEYRDNFASPYRAAEVGFIDEVIFPEDTRPKLIKALLMLQNKNTSIPGRRHGNIPL